MNLVFRKSQCLEDQGVESQGFGDPLWVKLGFAAF